MNPLKKENLLKTTGNKRALSQKKTTSELYFKYIYFKACVLYLFCQFSIFHQMIALLKP